MFVNFKIRVIKIEIYKANRLLSYLVILIFRLRFVVFELLKIEAYRVSNHSTQCICLTLDS